ncbi:MAG: hypothetical protein KatS3mg027_1114 [Bacteroidia bacterium]|nr:MAG: hypothetical protein KatS3mg027_1114 [Bacteroidia bacterium]
MTIHNFFQDIFSYNHDVNQIWLKHLSDLNVTSSNNIIMKLFSHLINAHQIWNHRILQKPIDISVWQIHSLQKLKEMDSQNFQHSLQIIDNYDFGKIISYTNAENKRFQNSVWEILFHIVNHSTHHRAQITKEVRSLGFSIPEKTDYIIYKRVK